MQTSQGGDTFGFSKFIACKIHVLMPLFKNRLETGVLTRRLVETQLRQSSLKSLEKGGDGGDTGRYGWQIGGAKTANPKQTDK